MSRGNAGDERTRSPVIGGGSPSHGHLTVME
jgi:hypothetical protein